MIVPTLLVVLGFVAAVLLLRPYAGRAPIWPFFEPLPLTLLAGAGLVLRARWEEIPARFAIHFALDGRPDGWAPRTPAAVFAPLAIGAIVILVLILVRGALAAPWGGPLAAPEAVSSRRYAGAIFLGIEHFVAIVFTTTSFLPLGATLRQVLSIVSGGIVLLVVALATSLGRLSRRPPDEPGSGGGWRAGGIVYGNATDPDLWIPKRIGIGWTLNFGHPAAWWVLALLLAGPIALVAGILLFVASR